MALIYQTDESGNSVSGGVSFEVSTDSGSNWIDMGVLENGYSFTYDFATTDREWGNAENPAKVAKNQKVTIAPSELATYKGVNFAAISGGLMTATAVVSPAAGIEVTSGSAATELVPFMVRFTHYTDASKTEYDYQHTIFRVNPDAGGITVNKNGAKSDTDYDLWTLALTGEVDSTLDEGEQLDKVYYADSVYDA